MGRHFSKVVSHSHTGPLKQESKGAGSPGSDAMKEHLEEIRKNKCGQQISGVTGG